MTHIIFCQKLKKEAEGLEYPPFPGELGEQIYNNISQEAWDKWFKLQTMLINEYRLNLLEPEARETVTNTLREYFFEDKT